MGIFQTGPQKTPLTQMTLIALISSNRALKRSANALGKLLQKADTVHFLMFLLCQITVPDRVNGVMNEGR